jgi:glucokinase
MIDIAVDFGGTNIKIGLIREGEVLSKTSIPAISGGGIKSRLADVEAAVRDLMNLAAVTLAEFRGIGIAIPGLVDTAKQTLLSVNDKYPDAIGLSFAEWAYRAFSLPSVLENDARAALIGEVAYGSARGENDAVLVIFGTGIGTAAIMNGEVVRGRHFQAGILGGHMATDIHGELCNCGNIGCAEAQAGHWAIPGIAKSHPLYKDSALANEEPLDYRAVIECANRGDPAATQLLDEFVRHWSAAIVNMIHAYDPQVVILSGGLMKSQKTVVPLLIEQVHRSAWTAWGKVRFTVADDPDTSVLLGVSHLLNGVR